MEESIFFFSKNRYLAYYLSILILNVMIPCISCSSINNGINKLLQSDFQAPLINQTSNGNQSYQSPMGAWECSNSCQLVSLQFYCNLYKISSCFQDNYQSINIQTSCSVGSSIRQNFTGNISANYTLYYDWMLPQSLTLVRSKTLAIYIDQIQVHLLVITNKNSTQVFFREQIDVNLAEGDHTIQFLMQGGDCTPFFIDNIELQVKQFTETNNSTNSTNNQTSNQAYNNSINSTLHNTTNQTQNNSFQSTSIQQNNTTANNSNFDDGNNSLQISNDTQPLGQMAEAANTAIDTAFSNQMTQFINSLPASRIALNFLMKFYINIDRFNFYKYHKQNLTYYSNIFLEAIYALKEAQGNLLKDIVQSKENQTIGIFLLKMKNRLINFMGFKAEYSKSYILTKNPLGNGFILNNIDFLCYQLPIIILMTVIFRFLFLITFTCRISLNFRKYCFLPIILVIIFQGNLQQFVYYVFAEFTYFFSKSFSHRLSNILILSFGFIIIFYCFGFFFSMRIYYQKKYRYFLDELNLQFSSIPAVMIDCGIVPLLSAIIQYYCIEQLLMESTLLVLMEFSWLSARIYFMSCKIYAIPFRVGINIFGNLLRILFLISLYLFNQTNDSQLYQRIHFYFIFSYIGIWIIETLLTVYLTIKELSLFIRKQKGSSTKVDTYDASHSNNFYLKKIKYSDKKTQNLVANQLVNLVAESNSKQGPRKIRISKYYRGKNDIILKRHRHTPQLGLQFKQIFQHK